MIWLSFLQKVSYLTITEAVSLIFNGQLVFSHQKVFRAEGFALTTFWLINLKGEKNERLTRERLLIADITHVTIGLTCFADVPQH